MFPITPGTNNTPGFQSYNNSRVFHPNETEKLPTQKKLVPRSRLPGFMRPTTNSQNYKAMTIQQSKAMTIQQHTRRTSNASKSFNNTERTSEINVQLHEVNAQLEEAKTPEPEKS